ncbi:discoidin domain-containing protein, partial [candidate division KSB1 bacterium]|nr:discoidin domain-containing protein [candidate division KSB1 bacterium]
GSISSYAWNFGDGNSSSAANPSHTYNAAGNYNAVLTVTDDQGATGSDNVAITVSGPQPPAAPSNLSANAVSTSQINLTWVDHANDEAGFKIERKTGANGTYNEIATLGADATSYPDNGLAAGTNYVYRVFAYNANGNSDNSNEASATTQGGSGNVNLALSKPATAMTSDASYPPSRANDGNTSNYWRSGSVSGSNPTNWWRVDLGATQTVARIVVRWKDSYFAKVYDIQISDDDANWATVYTNNAGAKGVQDISFAPSSARYVRIYMRANQKSNYRIIEFEVYASGSLGKGLLGAEEKDAIIPAEIALEQNYPNPFNPSTNISFALTEEAHVTLRVYDMLGAKVATLVNGVRPAGRHTATFDARDLPTGTYYYVLQVGETRLMRRLSFVK